MHHPEFPEKLVIKHADIQLRRGEVVGLAGLMGAGRTEFAMSVFGKSYGCSITGEVYKGGRKIDVSTVPKAIENGIAYRLRGPQDLRPDPHGDDQQKYLHGEPQAHFQGRGPESE